MSEKLLNKEKRVPKNQITYKIQLTGEQKEAKKLIEDNKVIILYGKAGTSKSLCAVYTALNLLFTRQTEKIWMIRPAIAIENLGFMPGSLEEKVGHYLTPLKQAMYKILDRMKVEKLILDKDVEAGSVAFLQGINLEDVLICDEAENMDIKQIRMLLSRLCKGGKIILTGDVNQVMLQNPSSSGFAKLISLCGQIPGFACMELTTNYRDEFVEQILELY